MIEKKREEGWVEMSEGVKRQSLVYGDKTHLTKFKLEKSVVIPMHDHPQEQTGYLLEGSMVLTIDGREHTLGPGDSWSIKGGIPHGVQVLEECLVLEVFSPVRQEYIS